MPPPYMSPSRAHFHPPKRNQIEILGARVTLHPHPIVRSDPVRSPAAQSMSHHDGSKPYQPRRGPERPPQPADEVAAPPPAAAAPAVDHLAAVAAEAEALNRYTEHQQQQQQQLQGHEQVGEEEDDDDEEEDEMEDDEDEQEGQDGGVGGEHVPMDADAAAAAAAAAGAQMDPHAAMVPGAVPPMAPNQLTLSFQGEVYVFDSVSPDKVPLLYRCI